MATTKLSVLLSRMNRFTEIETIEEQYKVRDLDEAIRAVRREMMLPWTLKKSTLRVFKNVLFYAIADDHDEIAFLDNDAETYSQKPHTKFTSLKQFLENPDTQNDMADVWDNNTHLLGVRYDSTDTDEKLLNNAETASDFSVSDDADSVTKDEVTFKEGSASMRIAITNSAGTATIKNTFTSFSDENYQRKYHFRYIYLDAVPTSIELRLQTDDSNYLATTSITTQFDGRPLVADDWNLVAHDLNTATETGTFDSTAIASEKIILTGAATGTYYIDTSYLRGWELLDYWYYSTYNVATVGETTGNQDFFFNSSEVYSIDSQLIGDQEWADVVLYETLSTSFTDEENANVFSVIENKRKKAWRLLKAKYPDMVPLITTNRYRFMTDYDKEYYVKDQEV